MCLQPHACLPGCFEESGLGKFWGRPQKSGNSGFYLAKGEEVLERAIALSAPLYSVIMLCKIYCIIHSIMIYSFNILKYYTMQYILG